MTYCKSNWHNAVVEHSCKLSSEAKCAGLVAACSWLLLHLLASAVVRVPATACKQQGEH